MAVSRVDAVIFDMDDVLIDYDFSARLRYLADLCGYDSAEIERRIFASGFDERADRGELDGPAYLAEFGERLGIEIALDDWIAARRQAMRPREAVWALVRRVGMPRAMLTNNGPLLRDALPALFPSLVALFPGQVHFSCDLPAAKPESGAFLAVCRALGTAPDRTAFIDDTPDYVVGARNTGLIAHRYRDVPTLAGFLGDVGVLRSGDEAG